MAAIASDRPCFKSKSEERRIKAATKADPKGLTATFQVWPAAPVGFGVAIKLDGKGIRSQFCADKQAIIAFVNEHL